jgi:hypothetical protein
LKGLGLEPNQVVGQSVFDIYKDFPEITTSINKTLAGEPSYFETKVSESSYSNFIVPYSLTKGESDGIVGVALDITERKHAEEKIHNQLKELRQWQEVTLNREDRIRQLKAEVNALNMRLGEPIRYASQGGKISTDQSTNGI